MSALQVSKYGAHGFPPLQVYPLVLRHRIGQARDFTIQGIIVPEDLTDIFTMLKMLGGSQAPKLRLPSCLAIETPLNL